MRRGADSGFAPPVPSPQPVTSSLHPRAEELLRELRLLPHPEGGHYREIFRSRRMVRTDDGRSERWAATSIYFLLCAGERSVLHRVASDEVWHHYEGAPVELLLIDPGTKRWRRELLGPVASDSAPLRAVPAGLWQAARTLGGYSLVGCTVAPGFEFSDFRLMRDDATAAAAFREAHPELAEWL